MAGIPTMTAGQSQKEVTFNDVIGRLGKLQTITPSSSVSISWASGGRAYLLLNRATTTITMSGAYDGQACTLIVKQDSSGSRAIAFASSNAQLRFGTDITSITITTTAAKTDYIGFVYNATGAAKFDVVAFSKGY